VRASCWDCREREVTDGLVDLLYKRDKRKPLDPKAFTGQLREEMEEALPSLNDRLPELDWVDIKERTKAGPIVLTDIDAVPERRIGTGLNVKPGACRTAPLLRSGRLQGALRDPQLAANLKQEPADPPTILLHHRYRALCRQKYRTATY
jgi:hypothetical protein